MYEPVIFVILLAPMFLVLVHDPTNQNSPNSEYEVIQSYHRDVNRAVHTALEENGQRVIPIAVDADLESRLVNCKPQFAFNCCGNYRKEEEKSSAPAILHRLGIPFTGSAINTCLNAFRKDRAKVLLTHVGIRTPKWMVIQNAERIHVPRRLSFPLFVKPVSGGCSYGITRENLIKNRIEFIAKLPELCQQFRQPILVEEFIPGREFTVGVLGNLNPQVLPIMEFIYHNEEDIPIRSYSLKMIRWKEEETSCPADLTSDKRAEIETLALRTYRALNCRDYARIDIRMNKEGIPFVLEVNAHPSLIPQESSFTNMAKKAGIEFKVLIGKILSIAVARYGLTLL